MPWCDECSRFLNPSTLTSDGACPSCGRAVATPTPAEGGEEPGTADAPPVPWHFKLLLVALVIYLAFRAVQGVVWVVHHV